MARLVRERDLKTEQGARSEAISWNKDGTFRSIINNRPTIGCSMLVGSLIARSYCEQDYWLTTVVEEILEETEEEVRFRTTNSIYTWYL